jgi:hypothetical protein
VTIGNAAPDLVTPPRQHDPGVKEVQPMTDEVQVTHRHGDDEEPMNPVDDGRIDGLRVRQYACGCGFAAAVLSRVEDQDPGVAWPFKFQASAPLI